MSALLGVDPAWPFTVRGMTTTVATRSPRSIRMSHLVKVGTDGGSWCRVVTDVKVKGTLAVTLLLSSADGSATAISECAVRHPRATTTHWGGLSDRPPTGRAPVHASHTDRSQRTFRRGDRETCRNADAESRCNRCCL